MTSTTSTALTYRSSPDVVSRHLGSGAVLVHLPSNQIFELNETGTAIWELLSQGAAPEQAANRLVERFDIDREAALAEIRSLASQFVESGLLTR